MAQDQFCMSFPPLSFPRNVWKWCLHIKYSEILSSWLSLNHPVSFVFPLALEKVSSSLPFLKTICQKSHGNLSIEYYLSCIEKEMSCTAFPSDNIPSIVVQLHLVKLPNFMNQNIGSIVNFIDVYVKVLHSCYWHTSFNIYIFRLTIGKEGQLDGLCFPRYRKQILLCQYMVVGCPAWRQMPGDCPYCPWCAMKDCLLEWVALQSIVISIHMFSNQNLCLSNILPNLHHITITTTSTTMPPNSTTSTN